MRIIFVLLFVILAVVGCDRVEGIKRMSDVDLTKISNNAIVCYDPYVRIGEGCCLDTNNNSICDKKEID